MPEVYFADGPMFGEVRVVSGAEGHRLEVPMLHGSLASLQRDPRREQPIVCVEYQIKKLYCIWYHSVIATGIMIQYQAVSGKEHTGVAVDFSTSAELIVNLERNPKPDFFQDTKGWFKWVAWYRMGADYLPNRLEEQKFADAVSGLRRYRRKVGSWQPTSLRWFTMRHSSGY